jgi:hypothetical protein
MGDWRGGGGGEEGREEVEVGMDLLWTSSRQTRKDESQSV